MLSVAEYVLDASALVALIRKEPGWEVVERFVPTAVVSAINFAETVYILRRRGMPLDAVRACLEPLFPDPEAFDGDQAYATAAFVEGTRGQGLSFADCACLALAHSRDVEAVTAERRWDQIELDVKIRRIR